MKKTIFTIAILAITLGFSTNANAQILDFLNKAVETVNKANETYNNARDAYNNTVNTYSNRQNSEPTYRVVGYATLFYRNTFNGRETSSGTTSADIVEDNSGTKKIKKGGSTYSFRENNRYDAYSSDFYSRYRYMVTIDGQLYFFDM